MAEARASGAEAMVKHLKLMIAKFNVTASLISERSRKILDQLSCSWKSSRRRRRRTRSPPRSRPPKPPRTTRWCALHPPQPVRAPLPAHLPRERIVVPGRQLVRAVRVLRKLGEDVTETLEVIPGSGRSFRPSGRSSPAALARITQPPAPSRHRPRRAGPAFWQ